MRLVDIHPVLDARDLAARFVPPRRFDQTRFDNYVPDPGHPSQAVARDALIDFAAWSPPARRRWSLRRTNDDTKRARYLDGGFGTGKTHLLASTWHAAEGPKAYMTFGELTAYIGFVGVAEAVGSLSHNRLICIDEFELDDVANTLMVVTFLRGVLEGGDVRLAVTSNTLPGRLGEQRFSASEFRREIQAIAAHFDEISIDGDDFRTSHTPPHFAPVGTLSTVDDFGAVMAHLRGVHPVNYGALVERLGSVHVTGMHPIADQDDALTFVAFVDKLYDSCASVRLEGCEVDELFDASYRNGGYRKKYGRAESRMAAMRMELSA